MSRLRPIMLSMLAVLAVGGVAASAAQAIESPWVEVAGKRLAAGEEKVLVSTIRSAKYKLVGSLGQTIECTTAGLETGAKIKGAAAGNSSTNTETVKYTGCTAAGNGTKCTKVHSPAVAAGTIVTKPLKSTLAREAASKVANNVVVTLFEPVTAPTFVELTFEAEAGGSCTVTSTKVNGSVAGDALSEGAVQVQMGTKTIGGKNGILRFPAALIKEVCVVELSACSFKAVKLETFGLGAKAFEGESNVKLNPEEEWAVQGL